MKYLLTVLCLVFFSSAHAHHAESNYSNDNLKQFRTWRFKDNSIAAKGQFLLVKEGKVFIEGNTINSYSITELSTIDQKYINHKLAKIIAIKATTDQIKKEINDSINARSVILYLFISTCVLIGLLVFLVVKIRSGEKSQALASVALTLLLCLGLSVINNTQDITTNNQSSVQELVCLF